MAYVADIIYYYPSGSLPGFQFSQELKFFKKNKNNKGFYFYSKFFFGLNKWMQERQDAYYNIYGLGCGIGWQSISGQKRLGIFEIAFGFKIGGTDRPINSYYAWMDFVSFRGPLSLLDNIIALGYRF